jgi:hypothetical protein
MLSSPSDDEVGALQGAIRAERAQRAEQLNSLAYVADEGRSGVTVSVMRTMR